MIAYKGFNKDMTCTMGEGKFQYQAGVTVDESDKGAKCARYGLHCTEDPLDVLDYYGEPETARYFIVKAEGDIHEDAIGTRISCTKLTPVKELSIQKLALHACNYIANHPERKNNKRVKIEMGTADGYFVIVRGKNPRAKGKKGSVLYLIKEEKKSSHIVEVAMYEVDGESIKEDTYYDVTGKEVTEDGKRRIKKAETAECNKRNDVACGD